jgi:RimJ/RimL family protein N-acetyltransferase
METLRETDRLTLRPFAETDADLLFELDSDPEVMRYLTGGAATPRRVIEASILPKFLRGGYWAAIEKATGEFAGWFSLVPADDPATLEVGYRLRRAAWGRGLATEGVQALIRAAFMDPGVERVVAKAYQDNLASRRVMEKLGMRLVRAFRITAEDLEHTGTFDVASNELWEGDDVEYAITRQEWQAGLDHMDKPG